MRCRRPGTDVFSFSHWHANSAASQALVCRVLDRLSGNTSNSQLDLASHCRVLLHDRPKHRRLIRFTVLYPLYVLSEIAIISTDLAELIGSAIGLCLLIPALPLWLGVLLTALDVLIFLVVGDPSRHARPVKMFELVIVLLVCAKCCSC